MTIGLVTGLIFTFTSGPVFPMSDVWLGELLAIPMTSSNGTKNLIMCPRP